VERQDGTLAAVYDRTIGASVSRIWENVLDWQHLPWLHRTSFANVNVLEESAGGWRGWVTSRSRTPAESLVDVRLDRATLRYVTATVDGEGAGSAITTVLQPISERSTCIHVEFLLPEPDVERARHFGAAYLRLYERLWNEDEGMMIRRQAILDQNGAKTSIAEPIGREVALGPLARLKPRLPLVLRVGGRELRLIEVEGVIRAHPTVCPHLGGPLGEAPIEDGCVTCPWHGYRYDLDSGRCVSGAALHLGPLPSVHTDAETGEANLVW
jgi:nitrite reductase/ring-hydroxylating ferredoxin subunit